MAGYRTNQLLRDAAVAAGISQSELSRRSGVSQGRISAYLADRHQLSVVQLSRLLEALDFDVRLSLVPTGQRRDVTRRWVLHRAVAEKLRTAPPEGWRQHALANLARSRTTVHGSLPQRCLDEWERLLADGDPERVVNVLLALGEREEEMRALSPFAGLLTEEERLRALADAR
jgi:transcriptional regulator with XRE-family HTH domain